MKKMHAKMTFWDWTAEIYDFFELFSNSYLKMLEMVAEIVPEGATVLEVAGGTGNISVAVSKKAKKVLCTDVSENMLWVAKSKGRGVGNIEWARRDIYHLKEEDGTWDVVVAGQVLHLLDKPEEAAREMKRVAKKMVVMAIPLTRQTTRTGRIFLGLYKVFGYRAARELTLETCRELMKEIGFVEMQSEFHFIPGTIAMCVVVWRKE